MRIDPRTITLILLSSLALAACAPQATPTPPPTQTPLIVTVVVIPTPEPTTTPTSTPQPTATATAIPPCEPSGTAWVTRFPTSQSTDDLMPVFRDEANRFIAALKAANASVKISETYRSPERAYLMHYAYVIARENFGPAKVPAVEGVNICWFHRDAEGNIDLPASKQAAEQMVKAYNIAFEPTIDSLHIERRAIDMTISWQGDLKIVDGTGKLTVIKSEPRNGNNAELHKVGASYGLTKLVSDPPHWFDDGGQ